MIPAWLQARQEDPPRSDRDAFIDRSLRSFLGLLSRFRPSRQPMGGQGRVDARVGLASTVLLILLVSLSHGARFTAFSGALLLVVLSFHRGERILRVLATSVPIAMITFLVMLPSAFWGNPASLTLIPLKVLCSVTAVRLLVENEPWGSILGALRIFFLPRLFILVLDITTRYLVLLGEHSLAMVWALKLRSVGHNRRKTASLAGIVGTLFLRSRELAEDTYAAMECRCFSGSYPARRGSRLGTADAVLLALDALTVLVFLAVGAS